MMIKVAAAVVIRDKKVLLVKQKNRDYWTPPGGLVEREESPEEACVRETKEEVGIDVDIITPLKIQRRWWPKRQDYLDVYNFLVSIRSGYPRCVDNQDLGDVEDFVWATLGDLNSYDVLEGTGDLFLEGLVRKESLKSRCQVVRNACVVVKDSQILLTAHNQILPDEDFCEWEGCIRKKLGLGGGRELEHCSAIHAEAHLISKAAKRGISLEGATLYSTTFPCSMCARAVAVSGVRKIAYFSDYVLENGREILEKLGVELARLT